jgi:hypothetical protein
MPGRGGYRGGHLGGYQALMLPRAEAATEAVAAL